MSKIVCSGNFKKTSCYHSDGSALSPGTCICASVYPLAFKFFQLASVADPEIYYDHVSSSISKCLEKEYPRETKFLKSKFLDTLETMVSKTDFDPFEQCPYEEDGYLCLSCWKSVFEPQVLDITTQIDGSKFNAIVEKPSPQCPFCNEPWQLDSYCDKNSFFENVYQSLEQKVLKEYAEPHTFVVYSSIKGGKSPLIFKRVAGSWFLKCGPTPTRLAPNSINKTEEGYLYNFVWEPSMLTSSGIQNSVQLQIKWADGGVTCEECFVTFKDKWSQAVCIGEIADPYFHIDFKKILDK